MDYITIQILTSLMKWVMIFYPQEYRPAVHLKKGLQKLVLGQKKINWYHLTFVSHPLATNHRVLGALK